MDVTHFIWDFPTDNCLMEKGNGGNTTASYVHTPRQYGHIISQLRSTTSYFHFDGCASTRNLTNPAQAITDSYEYTSFGELLAVSGATNACFLYNGARGYYYDQVLGSIDVRHRRYHPNTMRWLSGDPILSDIAMSTYAYAANNPVRLFDSSGMNVLGPAVGLWIGCAAAHYFAVIYIFGRQVNDRFDHCLWVCSTGKDCGDPQGISGAMQAAAVEAVYEMLEVFCQTAPCPPNWSRHGMAEAIHDMLSDSLGVACAASTGLFAFGCWCCCKALA